MTMRVQKQDVFRFCAICERTLLMGEHAHRYAVGRDEWVDVCSLCTDAASEHGWVREGSPTAPLLPDAPRRRKRLPSLHQLFETRRPEPEDEELGEPVLRRLSAVEQAMVRAAELFNKSPYRRTVAGIQKSLGDPRVSLLPLSGVNREVVLTIAWEISWYQYRVVADSSQPVRLADRGYELDELDPRFAVWNGKLGPGARVAADIPRF